MKKTILAMAGILVLGWAAVQGQTSTETATQSQQNTTEQVQLEEYVKKEIVFCKLGNGPGEIGTDMVEGDGVRPGDIIVDNKKNIYILDTVNNRVQKFDKNGKYLLNIPVTTWTFDEDIKKGRHTPSVKIQELQIDDNDNIYIPQYKDAIVNSSPEEKVYHKYNVNGKLLDKIKPEKLKIEKKHQYSIKLNPQIKRNQQDVIVKNSNGKVEKISLQGKHRMTPHYLGDDIQKNIYIFNKDEGIVYKLNPNGKFKATINLEGRNYRTDSDGSIPFMDKNGNIYEMTVVKDPDPQSGDILGFKVIKWEKK